MRWNRAKLVPRSAPAVLLLLLAVAVAGFAAVGHLVNRFNANQQSRGQRLYEVGRTDSAAGNFNVAVDDFRAALTCDPGNSQYQLSLARALRDTGDPKRLDEAESYLESLWQRSPQDGPVNLALGRVAARRGSVDDAIRYYHNAMYGVWTADADENRRKARIELIEFLLQKKAHAEAESELMTLAALLPPNAELHLKAARLFDQDQNYSSALAEYQQVLRLDRANAAAMAGAGEAAYRSGRYRTAEHFLEQAVKATPQDANSHELLDSASLILRIDPFVRRISDAERNRRIGRAFEQAGERLTSCAQARGLDLRSPEKYSGAEPLAALAQQRVNMKPKLSALRSAAETDLPDAIMDLVFQIEQQSATECGDPQGTDKALLLISRDREGADR